MTLKKVYILSASRTPIGSFGGVFKDVSAIQLGSTAIKAAIEASKIEKRTSVKPIWVMYAMPDWGNRQHDKWQYRLV